ncbi:hypothetical protein CDAR_124931 [Caerostris darwini]|uniref:Uncharacterized protein n=1 Tax=Caerostris darwini TaxID=1538125 RepID=A0AAV4TEC8_9ARAC|nr:hypothetical protein CDAR_124931 [Caerostris darwini]
MGVLDSTKRGSSGEVAPVHVDIHQRTEPTLYMIVHSGTTSERNPSPKIIATRGCSAAAIFFLEPSRRSFPRFGSMTQARGAFRGPSFVEFLCFVTLTSLLIRDQSQIAAFANFLDLVSASDFRGPSRNF